MDQGGRRSAISSGYRATCWIGLEVAGKRTYNDATVYLLDQDRLGPGERGRVRLRPHSPAYWSHVDSGTYFELVEGPRLIGLGTVLGHMADSEPTHPPDQGAESVRYERIDLSEPARRYLLDRLTTGRALSRALARKAHDARPYLYLRPGTTTAELPPLTSGGASRLLVSRLLDIVVTFLSRGRDRVVVDEDVNASPSDLGYRDVPGWIAVDGDVFFVAGAAEGLSRSDLGVRLNLPMSTDTIILTYDPATPEVTSNDSSARFDSWVRHAVLVAIPVFDGEGELFWRVGDSNLDR
jgi:hypothetical protein